jgi:hypothetical protein
MVPYSLDDGQQSIDLHGLATLGELVWPVREGAEIMHLAELVKARRGVNFDELLKKRSWGGWLFRFLASWLSGCHQGCGWPCCGGPVFASGPKRVW